MTYQEVLDYLYQQLPMFQRIGNAAFKKSLDNIITLCNALGNPQNNYKTIHVAGTNGKGSSSHMLAAVLQESGYKTGLYTSPHLKSFTERVRVNGLELPQQYLIDFVENYKNLFEEVQPSFFEMTVALAFQYFADEKVDVAVIEVGLGGRLDSTNIITPDIMLLAFQALSLPLPLSLAAVYIFVERYLTLKKAAKNPEGFNDRIKSMVLAGDINGAKMLCAQTNTPVSRMLSKGISRIGNPLKNIETSIENVGKIEISRLERNLSGLATIAGAAPMLGFLGTVTGMIQAFIAIAQAEGSISPKLLSGGIYEAMVTTAAGLIIGLPAYVGYNYLVSKIDSIVHSMEYSSIEFLDLLQEPQL